MKLKPETVGFVRGGMLFLELPHRWRVWQRNVWSCCGAGAPDFRYVYFWHRMDRKGQACAVLARGTMNSCLVLFEDGFTAVTSRNALRRRPA